MSRKRGVSRPSKSANKRAIGKGWKNLAVADNEIFDLQEDGLISLEELTDYSITEIRSPDLDDEPKIKRLKPDSKSIILDQSTELLSVEKGIKDSQKVKNAKKKRRKKKSGDKIAIKTDGLASVAIENHTEAKPQTVMSDDEQKDDEIGASETSENAPVEQISLKSKKPKIECDMSEWNGLGIPDEILAALADKRFTQPTPIQAATLPVAIFHHQDIIGAAETGSGKTLAFSLPILTHILDMKNKKEFERKETDDSSNVDLKPLYAIILTPTRELALQINKHIVEMTKYIPVKCAVIVGGLSEQKQERVLSKCPEIVIGTPGRLLNLINSEKPHLKKLDAVKFLVLDEVDRMLQFGHFKEASEILRLMSLRNTKRQTFLFSATLTLPQYHKKLAGKAGKKNSKESVQMLVDKANVNSKAKVINLSSQHIAAEQIEQRRIICTEEEKDLYMLYVLLCFPGRTLIFVNSINCTRKICNLLTILGRNPLQLHAGKQQRQRLKALDRFTSLKDAVMVATDVAARGLDIPDVDVVVHYHLPKDPKIYIHRSGRTARAKKGGVSIILEGPEDFREYKKIYDVMKLEQDLPSMDVDSGLLPDLKKRVSLAMRVEKEEHQQRKVDSDKSWFQRAAKSLDVDFDEHQSEDKEEGRKKTSSKLKLLKKELNQLLKLPLVPKGFSGTYITRTGSLQKIGL